MYLRMVLHAVRRTGQASGCVACPADVGIEQGSLLFGKSTSDLPREVRTG